MDVSGNVVKDIGEGSGSIRFNTNDLPSGIYILQIKADNGTVSSTKIVVE